MKLGQILAEEELALIILIFQFGIIEVVPDERRFGKRLHHFLLWDHEEDTTMFMCLIPRYQVSPIYLCRFPNLPHLFQSQMTQVYEKIQQMIQQPMPQERGNGDDSSRMEGSASR